MSTKGLFSDTGGLGMRPKYLGHLRLGGHGGYPTRKASSSAGRFPLVYLQITKNLAHTRVLAFSEWHGKMANYRSGVLCDTAVQ
jgi:hypothetical protein